MSETMAQDPSRGPKGIHVPDEIYDAFHRLGPRDLVPPELLEILVPAHRIWLSDSLDDPEFGHFVDSQLYARYRNGGSLENLLASFLFASEVLNLLSDDIRDSSPSSTVSTASVAESQNATSSKGATSSAAVAKGIPDSSLHTPASGRDQVADNTCITDDGNKVDVKEAGARILKSTAMLTYTDRLACIFEWNTTFDNYLLAYLAAFGAVRHAAENKDTEMESYALDILGNVLEIKWSRDHILGDLEDSVRASKAALALVGPEDKKHQLLLSNYAGHLELRYAVTKQRRDITEAIRLCWEIYNASETDIERARAAVNIASKLIARATTASSSTKDDVEQAINLFRIALQLTPPNLPERWSRLRNMSIALALKAEKVPGNSRETLQEALSYGRQALIAVSPMSPERESLINNLSSVLQALYVTVNDPQDRNLAEIEESIHWTREAMIIYEQGHATSDFRRSISVWNDMVAQLAERIFLKYQQTNCLDDAEEARKLGEIMLKEDGTPFGAGTSLAMHPAPQDYGEESVSERNAESESESSQSGDMMETEDETEVVDDDTPIDLSTVFIRPGAKDGEPVSAGSSKRDFGYWLKKLPASQISPAPQRGVFARVREMVHAFFAFVLGLKRFLTPRSYHPTAIRDNERVLHILDRINRVLDLAGKTEDDQASQQLARQALQLVQLLIVRIEGPEDITTMQQWINSSIHAHSPSLLRALSQEIALSQNSHLVDVKVKIMIQAVQRAIELTPERSPQLAEHLAELADVYRLQYRQGRDLVDFHAAFKYAKMAIGASYFSSNVNQQPRVAIPLATLLEERYKQLGSLDDLQNSIKLAAETVMLLDKDDDARPELLQLLIVALIDRHKRSNSVLDLEAAIIMANEALRSSKLTKMMLVAILVSICAILGLKHTRLSDEKDLDRLITVAEIASRLASAGEQQRPIAFHSLSLALRKRFQRTPDEEKGARIQDIDKAIEAGAVALFQSELVPFRTAQIAISLANSHMARFEFLAEEKDRTFALEAFKTAGDASFGGPAQMRIEALKKAAQIQVTTGMHKDALACLEQATDLLATISSLDITQDDKQALLSEVSGLPSDAAALAILVFGDVESGPLRALDLLERGRGTILGTIIQERSEAVQLMSIDAGLHRRFQELQVQIAKPRAEPNEVLTYHAAHSAASEAADNPHEKMEKLLKEIRQIDGLGHFLLTPSKDELLRLAKDGAIITIFNSIVCNKTFAIIVTEEVRAIELPGMSTEGINHHIEAMQKIRRNKSKNHFIKGRKLLPVLAWLWETAVKPIMDALGFTGRREAPHEGRELPRVWWIGVGLLTHFPFHAAGNYDNSEIDSAMDMVISTYSPTIKSLLYAMEKPMVNPNCPNAKTCFVTMEETPGYKRLDGVEDEARDIQQMLPHDNSVILTQPTAADVTHQIGDCNMLHLACHGESDYTDPSRSHLVLARTDMDGRSIARQDKLYAGTIMKTRGNGSGIAFLRACFSADNPAHGLSDEVIHLASAFQLSGFNHVLATLWSTRNSSCGEVSKRFYKNLLTEVNYDQPSHRTVAVTFYRAVNELRLESMENPLLWASFVHIGA
ncbi:hypothetical protein IL306_014158 [Fusarium sp. DS 682]|nr:hypothetical protein IL306_014158 [Fusarium sp. DS 682]